MEKRMTTLLHKTTKQAFKTKLQLRTFYKEVYILCIRLYQIFSDKYICSKWINAICNLELLHTNSTPFQLAVMTLNE